MAAAQNCSVTLAPDTGLPPEGKVRSDPSRIKVNSGISPTASKMDWVISEFICGNKMPTRCNRGFYCRFYCSLNMFRASLCPSSGAQEYYTVVAACGILCCGFSSSWSGVELRVMHPVCRMLVKITSNFNNRFEHEASE